MSESLLSQDIDPSFGRRILRRLFTDRRAAWLRRITTITIGLAACATWSKILALAFVALTLLFAFARLYLFLTGLRIFRRLFRPKRITITPEGYLFIIVSVGVGAAAINTGYSLLYLVFALLLALVVTSGVVSEIMTRGLSLSRSAPQAVFQGERFEVTVTLTNRKRFFWAQGLRITEAPIEEILKVEEAGFINHVGPRESVSCRMVLSLHRRGPLLLRGVVVETLFPFAFFRKRLAFEAPETVVVYPRIVPVDVRLESGARMRALRRVPFYVRGEEDFRGLREFRDGDNPRRIHWPLSAKHQKLLVREMDAKRADRLVVLLEPYLVSSQYGEEFERAVSLAASLLWEAHRRGYETGLLTRLPQRAVCRLGSGRRTLLRQLETLAHIEPLPPDGGWLMRLDLRDIEGAKVYLVSARPCALVDRWRRFIQRFAATETVFGETPDVVEQAA